MAQIRRAFFAATGERYVVLMINLILLATISRLLPAREIGIALIGIAVLTVVGNLRDFGLAAFIVQRDVVTRVSIRTAFTVTLMIATLLACVILAAQGVVAGFYQEEQLGTFLQIVTVSLLVGTLFGPSGALLQRAMEFKTLALIHIAGAIVNCGVAVALALAGFGALSIAWAAVAQSVVVSTLGIFSKSVLWAYRPCLKDWREFITFGTSASLYGLVSRLYDNLPYFVLGRLLPLNSVALFNRATMICDLPLKGLLSGVFPVALPALAIAAREDRSLAHSYLRALSYITAVHWPGLLLVAFLAHPIVTVIVGPAWHDVVPLVQIMAIANLFSSPSLLAYPMLVSAGAVNIALLLSLVTLPVCAAIFVLAASYGVKAAALSLLLTIPLENLAGLWVVRKRAFFHWNELASALRESLIVTLCTMIGPVVILLATGLRTDISVAVGVAIGLLGAIGWFIGVFCVRHPLLKHIPEVMQLGPDFPFVRQRMRQVFGKLKS
ncbi:MAG: oligosaccharide flippase family protein [Hyphomicrobiaceae bacterium]